MMNTTILKSAEALIDENYDEFCSIRKKLHQTPELGYDLYETSKIVKSYLDEWGISYTDHIAKTGIVAMINEEVDGPTIALRADMDALPIKEETEVDFVSSNEGSMHACGHDVHTTTLLGTAKILNIVKDKLNCKIKLIFQPAEEMVKGATKMIAGGALEDPKPDFIFGMHVWPELNLGEIGVKSGSLMASMDVFEVTVRGMAGHGAAPHQGIDAIVGTSQIITSLQTILSREINPVDAAVMTIGTIEGGQGFNIIPEEVKFKGTVRTVEKETRFLLKERFESIVNNVAQANRLTADIDYDMRYPITINTPSVVYAIHDGLVEEFGENRIVDVENPSLASEDFACYLEEVPGTFFFLGVNDGEGGSHKLHNSYFLPPFEAIKNGISLFLFLVLNNELYRNVKAE